MARTVWRGLFVVLVFLLVGCDHATKIAAKAILEGARPVAVVPGLVDLEYTENRDTAFSLLHGVAIPHRALVLGGAAALVLLGVAIAWWRRRRAAGAVEHTAFAFIVAGAIGNVADRAGRGYVVDFIHMRNWPVFNVADAAVVAGVILLAVLALAKGRATPPPAPRSS